MAGTIALFITVFILLCIFALIFVCYRAGRDSRQDEQQDEEAGTMQRATIVLSIVPGSATAAGLLGQPYSSQRAHASSRKTPTPPTIVRNLPCMIWDKPKASATAAAGSKDVADVDSAESNESLCVICCCDYEAGERIKLLPCLHMYHQLCIDAWLERSHVCPVCQADVVRAAGLSAAVGDWSVHTQQAVDIISGVQHVRTQPQPTDSYQQPQPQHVSAPQTPEPEHGRVAPMLPVSSPAADSQRASSGSSGGGSGSSGGNSTADAVALVVTSVPGGSCSDQASSESRYTGTQRPSPQTPPLSAPQDAARGTQGLTSAGLSAAAPAAAVFSGTPAGSRV